MKQFKVLIVSLLLILIPFKVKAYQEGITSFYIDATVLNNGDINMKELIILNGEFNGFERIINFKNNGLNVFNNSLSSFYGSDIYNGEGIELISIQNIDVGENSSFDIIYSTGDIFEEVYSASTGDYGKYIETNRSNGVTYRIYNPSKGKVRGFYIEYVVKNLGVVHEDVSEIYMNLFDELTEYVNYLEMHIHIPNNQNLLRGWAHGPLTGNIKLENNQFIKVTASMVSPNTPIDVRFAFDKEVLNKSSKSTNVQALDKIISVETERANEANNEREEARLYLENNARESVLLAEQNPTRENYQTAYEWVVYLSDDELKTTLMERLEIVLEKVKKKEAFIKFIYTNISILWIIGLIYLVYRFYKKYDKEYEASFKGDYYRDFPASYGPEIVGYLLNKKIESSDLSACLMNLIYKKAVLYEEQIVGKRNKKTYLLTPNTDGKDLTQQERQLIGFLLENKPTTLEEIQKRAKRNYESFISGFQSWKDITVDLANSEEFFESHTSKKILNILYVLLGLVIVFLTNFNPYHSYQLLNIAIIILVIASFFYFISSSKRTQKGNEDYRKWMGLKKFLNDFSNMEKRKLPEVTLWEKYLVYALPLGCAKQLAKDMEIRIKDIDPNALPSDYMFDIGYMNRMLVLNRIVNDSVVSSVNSAFAEKSRQQMSDISSSSSSSGGGFGGGFSSGGGFGGGGGGGGRF